MPASTPENPGGAFTFTATETLVAILAGEVEDQVGVGAAGVVGDACRQFGGEAADLPAGTGTPSGPLSIVKNWVEVCSGRSGYAQGLNVLSTG